MVGELPKAFILDRVVKWVGGDWRWVQAVFKEDNVKGLVNDSAIDLSEGMAVDMFGVSPSSENEIIEVNPRGWNFRINLLSKEHQHTCKSTGLMLWESARLMASILAENLDIVEGKRVLELGCGCGGFDVIVGTDVTYIPEAILPLFATARELIASSGSGGLLEKESPSIISNWFLDNGLKDDVPSTALHILLFHKD
ncbi:hypothetical protein K1719_010452 [Acacia pycnantha]|nr:hypothetical protein K1719_010452 [Acacia pycnantha]